MKERPILFSGPMVRAILEGRKTQTRRVVKDLPNDCEQPFFVGENVWCFPANSGGNHLKCPYGVIGDRLWVKENWKILDHDFGMVNGQERPSAWFIKYKADSKTKWRNPLESQIVDVAKKYGTVNGTFLASIKKAPAAIFMPRWASRITLEITDVRVQRVQEISEADARAEGAEFFDGRPVHHHGWRHDPHLGVVWSTAKLSFKHLWDSINGKKHSWESNPWVWVISFKRVEA